MRVITYGLSGVSDPELREKLRRGGAAAWLLTQEYGPVFTTWPVQLPAGSQN